MLVDFKQITTLCLSTLCHENKLFGHIKSFSVHFMYFQCQYGSFYKLFEEFYTFAVIMNPFQTSYLAPYILNTPF